MEFFKIVALAIVAAVMYGIVHDQITARICLEYFTVFHPPVFHTKNPTLLGFGWGVFATWWAGCVMGLLLAMAARAGSPPRTPASRLLKPVASLLAVMALCALSAGWYGYHVANDGSIQWLGRDPHPDRADFYPRLMAAYYAHSASYASGFLGALVLCVFTMTKRMRSKVL